ncbi:MAG: hypothetical protein B6D34_01200 [Candidatus Brocadia sp. UTAMX1]|nr:MAG: hypothetical protein B6D34_01200 [Candidatus Brocadia sp. UTAMX1]
MILRLLEGQSQRIIFLLCLVSVTFIGVADYVTGTEISFSLFYIVPIAIAAWYSTQRICITISAIAALIWLIAERTSGHQFSHIAIPYWNMFVRLGTFLIIAYLLSELRHKLRKEEERANTDPLTGVFNCRTFYELVEKEIQRLRRYNHPFTIAYIDIDDFKMVNDRYGHMLGDAILQKIVLIIKENKRETDIAARLGGDEFAIMFLETGLHDAVNVVRKIVACMHDKMGQTELPVTFSVGVVTYEVAPNEVNQALKLADDLMYSVKKKGKNAIAHIVWKGDAACPDVKNVSIQ